jgi:hypothetical protein
MDTNIITKVAKMQLRLRFVSLVGLAYALKLKTLYRVASRKFVDSCGKKNKKKFHEKSYSSSGFAAKIMKLKL